MNILREIRVPQESVNDETVNVMRTFFAQGSKVTAKDVLIELETSKINISLEAEAEGFVYYHCSEGDDVPINALVVVIVDEIVEGGLGLFPKGPDETGRDLSPKGPRNGVDDETRFIASTSSILPPGPFGERSLPMESSPPGPVENQSQPNESPYSGTCQKGPLPCREAFTGEPAFSALALGLIETHGLTQSTFAGYDLVTSEDVLAYVQRNSVTKSVATSTPPAKSVTMADSAVTRKNISKSKKREIEYLRQVQQAGLNSMVNIEVDTNGILAATAPHLNYFKHSLLPVILYEASRLLLKYPQLNAFYQEQEIWFYNDVNVGVAIDIDDGLKTVSIRNTVSLGMRELEHELFSLSNKYLDRTLTPSDMADITFTVTDLSGESIHFFSPLINQHNSAILGIAAAKPNGAMVLSLTFDHRVTEGKAASGFLRELKERLEDYKNRLGTNSPNYCCSQCRKPLSEDLSGFGFLKIVNKIGTESLLCQTCFKGL